MQAVNMLESMFEWLLQPARPDEMELPGSPSAALGSRQPAPAAEVRPWLRQLDRSAIPVSAKTPEAYSFTRLLAQ